ncbi:MAG: hypothetical protein ABL998_06035 [Planctomycetota bacterium]
MKALLPFIVLLLSATACKSQPPVPEGAAVRIKQDHYHTRYCGHYRFGEQWYFIAQHRHGVDCDHELVAGEWILPTEN